MDNKENDPKAVRTENIIEDYKNLKNELKNNGLEQEAEDLVAYTLANSFDDAEASYPTLMNKDNEEEIGFVLLKKCPIDDAKTIVSGARSQKMVVLLQEIKKIKPGSEIDLEKILKEFNG